mmetsp:Transcript_36134/g.76107  ORF Transcript_36134/g.76107 Transcript_36134/m.76107 type:complete len:146 (-) Transcript_36134:51-488(-)
MDCIEGLRVLLRLIAEEGCGVRIPDSTATTSDRQIMGEEAEETKTRLLHNDKEETKLMENDDANKGNEISIQQHDNGGNGGNSIVSKPAFISQSENNSLQPQQSRTTTTTAAARKWNLPTNTAVELAVLQSGHGRMKRVRLSSLF